MSNGRDFAKTWQNWSSLFRYFPRQIFQPEDVTGIADVVKKAVLDARHVRVAGSRWSYSDIAVTHDYAVDVGRLPQILAFSQGARAWGHAFPQPNTPPPLPAKASPVLPSALLAAVERNSSRLFAHLEAGVTVKQIHSSLDRPEDDVDIGFGLGRGPWALPTFGGSDGQTVAGAVATSTHGGDFGLPPLQEMVRAIHLVDGSGVQHWIEGAGPRAITDPSKLAASLPGVVVHYDDGLFRSALVAMGCLGVVYSLVIEVVPQYGLVQGTATASWPAVRAWLSGDQFTKVPLAADQGAFGPATRFLEVLVSPYRRTDDYSAPDPTAARSCVVTLRHLNAGVPMDPPPAPALPMDIGKVVNAVNKVWGALHGDQKASRETIDVAFAFLRADRRTLTSSTKGFKVLGSGGGFIPVQSVEFAISTRDDRHVSFLSDLLAGFDDLCRDDPDNAYAGAFGVRLTLPTEAHLGIQQPAANPFTAPQTERICHVEVITAMKLNLDLNNYYDPRDFQGRSALYVQRFEEIAAKYPDAHLHWGMLSLTDLHQPSRYVGFSSWMQAWKALVGTSRAFDNDFTVRYAISRRAAGWAVLSAAPPQDLPRAHAAEATPELLPGSPTTHPDDAQPAHLYPPTVFPSAAGELEVVVLGSDGQACWNQRNLSSQGKEVWSGWQVLYAAEPDVQDELTRRIHFVGRIAQALNADGHVEIFARCGDTDRIFHAWRTSPSGTDWEKDQGFNVKEPRSQWREMDKDTFASSPDVILDGDGHLHLVARTAAGDVRRRCQNPTGWSAWEGLPKSSVPLFGDPAVVAGASRVLTVVCRDASGGMWCSRQTKPESGASWTGWVRLGTSKITLRGDPVAVRDATPRLRVFALGAGPSGGVDLFEIGEVTPNATWDADWSVVPTGVPPIDGRRPSAILDRGVVHVAFLDRRQEVRHLTEAGGSWTVHALGGPFTSFPSVAANADGRLEIGVKFANDLVQHRWQVSPGQW